MKQKKRPASQTEAMKLRWKNGLSLRKDTLKCVPN